MKKENKSEIYEIPEEEIKGIDIEDEDSEDEEEVRSKKEKEAMKNIEAIIKKELHTLNEGIDTAREGAYMEGLPLFVVYYDRENDGCLLLDENKIGDIFDNYDEILSKFVWNHPERFVRIPHEFWSQDYDLMVEFAEKYDILELISALQGQKPMATFNYRVGKLGLEKEWRIFRDSACEEKFEKWRKRKGI